MDFHFQRRRHRSLHRHVQELEGCAYNASDEEGLIAHNDRDKTVNISSPHILPGLLAAPMTHELRNVTSRP